jgi:primase-polymerase (primpol)-like protein
VSNPAQPPPKYIRPNFERMPAELKQRPNWVLWVPIWKGSKWTKRPIQPTGFGASSTNPEHWSCFKDVKQAYERAVEHGYVELRQKGELPQRVFIGGVGFVFDGQPDDNGLVFAGIDFDKVISGGEIASLAKERIKRLVHRKKRIRQRIAYDRQSATVAKRNRS